MTSPPHLSYQSHTCSHVCRPYLPHRGITPSWYLFLLLSLLVPLLCAKPSLNEFDESLLIHLLRRISSITIDINPFPSLLTFLSFKSHTWSVFNASPRRLRAGITLHAEHAFDGSESLLDGFDVGRHNSAFAVSTLVILTGRPVTNHDKKTRHRKRMAGSRSVRIERGVRVYEYIHVSATRRERRRQGKDAKGLSFASRLEKAPAFLSSVQDACATRCTMRPSRGVL